MEQKFCAKGYPQSASGNSGAWGLNCGTALPDGTHFLRAQGCLFRCKLIVVLFLKSTFLLKYDKGFLPMYDFSACFRMPDSWCKMCTSD